MSPNLCISFESARVLLRFVASSQVGGWVCTIVIHAAMCFVFITLGRYEVAHAEVTQSATSAGRHCRGSISCKPNGLGPGTAATGTLDEHSHSARNSSCRNSSSRSPDPGSPENSCDAGRVVDVAAASMAIKSASASPESLHVNSHRMVDVKVAILLPDQ